MERIGQSCFRHHYRVIVTWSEYYESLAFSWSFRMLRLIARLSKYDFWNHVDFLSWYRFINISNKHFSRFKKKSRRKKFKKMINFAKSKISIFWKSKFWKFWDFKKSQKKFKFSNFQIFDSQNFRKNVLQKMTFFQKTLFEIFCREIFWSSKIIFRKLFFIYIDPKFPKDSKNHT